jgi:hypothetical protein
LRNYTCTYRYDKIVWLASRFERCEVSSMREALGGAIREGREVRRGRFFGLEYKWSALSCTSLGALLATINNGTLIIALPELARSLNTDVFSLVWVLLSYMLAQTALVLMVGRFADMIGRKKL